MLVAENCRPLLWLPALAGELTQGLGSETACFSRISQDSLHSIASLFFINFQNFTSVYIKTNTEDTTHSQVQTSVLSEIVPFPDTKKNQHILILLTAHQAP